MNIFGNKNKEKQKMREGKEYILIDVRGHLICSFNTFVIFIPAFIEEKQT